MFLMLLQYGQMAGFTIARMAVASLLLGPAQLLGQSFHFFLSPYYANITVAFRCTILVAATAFVSFRSLFSIGHCISILPFSEGFRFQFPSVYRSRSLSFSSTIFWYQFSHFFQLRWCQFSEGFLLLIVRPLSLPDCTIDYCIVQLHALHCFQINTGFNNIGWLSQVIFFTIILLINGFLHNRGFHWLLILHYPQPEGCHRSHASSH